MNIILPKDLKLRQDEGDEFQYCISELETQTILPITIANIEGEILIQKYCLKYPPEWGEIIECEKLRKNPINLRIKTNSEITISLIIPEFETTIGLFGLKISDNEATWNTRFKIINPASPISKVEEEFEQSEI